MKKTLAQMFYGKPMELVEYQTLSYMVADKGGKFELTEMVQLTSGAWVSGQTKLFNSIAEIDALMVPKFKKIIERAGYETSSNKIRYELVVTEKGV